MNNTMENLDRINLELHKVWPAWTAVAKIGEGSFGKVYRIVREGKFESALKIIDIPSRNEDVTAMFAEGADAKAVYYHFQMLAKQVQSEIELMESMKSAPHIVSMEDHAVIQRNSASWRIYIRMELLQSVGDYIRKNGPLSEAETLKLSLHVCDGLRACHNNNIIHRDIKPGNIFRNRFGDYKLGDFGIARKLEGTMASTRAGTPSYEAPEVAKGLKYDKTADIYAVGMVLYVYMNRGRKPFLPLPPQMVSPMEAAEAQQKRFIGMPLPPPADASRELSEIILKACAYQPADRYQTVEELTEALEEYVIYRKRDGKRKSIREQDDDQTAVLWKGNGAENRFEYNNEYNKRTVSGQTYPSGGIPDGSGSRKKQPDKKHGILKAVLGIAAGLILVAGGFFIGSRFGGEHTKDKGPEPVTISPPIKVTDLSTPEPVEELTPISEPTPTSEPTTSPKTSVKIGQTISFGTYEQDNDTSQKEEIEWIVLAKEGNQALLISKYALDCQKYNHFFENTSWSASTLRVWLNSTFYTTAFSKKERSGIVKKVVKNDKNERFGTDGGIDTKDWVFLLSLNEAKEYFKTDEERKCSPTAYAKTQGVRSGSDGICWWWLRSPGFYLYDAARVLNDGSIHDSGRGVDYEYGAVRPALWIDLDSGIYES